MEELGTSFWAFAIPFAIVVGGIFVFSMLNSRNTDRTTPLNTPKVDKFTREEEEAISEGFYYKKTATDDEIYYKKFPENRPDNSGKGIRIN